MKSFGLVSLLAALSLLVASGAVASQGDPRVVQGVLAWTSATESTPFIIVLGDDGRHYAVDLSGAQRRGEPMKLGDRVSAAGVEGSRPWQMSALVVGSGDSALTALSNPSSSPGTTAPAPLPPESSAASPRPWRRIEGTVDAVRDRTLHLRDTTAGREVTVDVSKLGGGVSAGLRRGERVTVFAVTEGDRRLVAVGFVQSQPGQGSASPRQPR